MDVARDTIERMIPMAVKDIAKNVIDSLPDEIAMDDIIHALYVNTEFEHGEREILDGKGIPHEQVRQRLGKWLR